MFRTVGGGPTRRPRVVWKPPHVVTEPAKPRTEVIFGPDLPANPECPTRFDITALWKLGLSPENKRPVDFLRLDSTIAMAIDLAVAYRGANNPRGPGGKIPPDPGVLESLGMVRTVKGVPGQQSAAAHVDGHLLIEHGRYVSNKFGILVDRGYELWQHQRAGQEAPKAETPPPQPVRVAIDPSDPIMKLSMATKHAGSGDEELAAIEEVGQRVAIVEATLVEVGDRRGRTAFQVAVTGLPRHHGDDPQ